MPLAIMIGSKRGPQPGARLAVLLCLARTLVCLTSRSGECFSTPPLRSETAAPAESTMRNYGGSLSSSSSSAAAASNGENLYTANYITAIEDSQPWSRQHGFMVATTDHNYAIYSPCLQVRGWISLTVNGDQVFIATTRNATISKSLFSLDEQERDFIAEVRSNFTQNLAGLKFAHYTSGSFAGLAPTPLSGASYEPASSGALLAISQLSGRPNGLAAAMSREPTAPPALALIQPGAAASAFQPIDSTASPPAGANLFESNELPPSAGSFFSRGLAAAASERANHTRAREQTGRPASQGRQWAGPRLDYSKPVQTVAQPQPQLQAPKGPLLYQGQPSVAATAVTAVLESPPPIRPETGTKRSLCSAGRPNENFNYYNLAHTPLNATLKGDVYYFDLHCNVLDVYSASVSVRQLEDFSALYRDHNFFAYSRSGLPLSINRFFLFHNQVFFVYNDGSVLVKMNWMLDQNELELVIEARQRLKLVAHWQGMAADLLAKGAASRAS